MAMSCPYCGGACDAEFVDVGVGGTGMQVTPYVCALCWASQISGFQEYPNATDEERRIGWLRGPPDPNPYQREPENLAAIKEAMLATAPSRPPVPKRIRGQGL